MAEQPVDVATHRVVVTDPGGRVLMGPWAIPVSDVAHIVVCLKSAHPDANVLVDGELVSVNPAPPAEIEAAPYSAPPNLPAESQGVLEGIRLMHTMQWATFDRAASLQAWMLKQASVFTNDLLDQNRKLADQASDLQTRFQEAMNRIDLMETERKLIEHDLMARRLSRHAVAQNRAEEEAARPPEPPRQPWIDELIAGVSAFLGAQRQPPRDWDRN